MEDIDWDRHNEEHVWQHGVAPEDVEDALRDPDVLSLDAYNRGGEKRWAVLGATGGDRLLFIVFTARSSSIRIVTARPATDREMRRYRKGRR